MIQILGNSTPSIPEAFQARLQAFDKDLMVCWHQPPISRQAGRWKIERCVKHHGLQHSHLCERVYILMCQDDEGTPMPLGDWVFTKLREMRSNWEALGGDTERGVRNAIAVSNCIDQELEQKRELASQDVVSYNRKDKRIQFNKLMMLIERHSMRPN